MRATAWLRRVCQAAALLGLAAGLAGCANVLPIVVERTPSTRLAAPADSALGSITREAGIPADKTAVWPLVQAAFALDARLTLIENATTSIDLQTYLIGDDPTGRLILRALRDAALRGVRVRLLVDDLYTADMDRLLLGLVASSPNVEVRLFNPFITERGSSMRRLLALAGDFKRLNHRMHNKLFVADGAIAVVGGRNLADEYFLRGKLGNFIDFDLLVGGAVTAELGGWFDLYWNSEQVFPVRDVVRASNGIDLADPALRAGFEQATRADVAQPVPQVADFFGAPAWHVQLAERRFHWLAADARSYADSPLKIVSDSGLASMPGGAPKRRPDTLTHRFLNLLGTAERDVLLISPYFIPGTDALVQIRNIRTENVRVRVVTNSLAVSDEPLVSVGFERHQVELLKLGVELYELSSTRLKLDRDLRSLLGESTGRLHAKLGIIDRRTVLVGSMNLDPRSSNINTEIGMAVESARLAAMIQDGFKIEELLGAYQVRLNPDGVGVRWTAVDAGADGEELDVDPDTSLWQRLRLLLISLFVPESQL